MYFIHFEKKKFHFQIIAFYDFTGNKHVTSVLFVTFCINMVINLLTIFWRIILKIILQVNSFFPSIEANVALKQ